jgi:predicted nucleic acid-binding protein
VREPGTSSAAAFHKRYDAIVWWGTSLEIAAALARLLRMRILTTREWTASGRLAQELEGTWSVIQPSAVLLNTAVELVRSHDLRAADALQLAAALRWSKNDPEHRVFLAGDIKLREAATLRGFDVPPL